jgi:hypothetical protein
MPTLDHRSVLQLRSSSEVGAALFDSLNLSGLPLRTRVMASTGGYRDDDSRREEDLAAVAVCAAAACSAFIFLGFVSVNPRHGMRLSNRNRNRATFAQVTTFLSDAEFHRAFRLRRTSFMELLAVLQTELSNDQRMEIVSSGSPVEPAVRLALTLRILGGGSHHDLAMLFRVATTTVYAVFHATIDAINNLLALPGIHLKTRQNCESWGRASHCHGGRRTPCLASLVLWTALS